MVSAYGPPLKGELESSLDKSFLGVFAYSRRALELVWQTSPVLTLVLAVLTVGVGGIPAATAYVGKLIVDGVVAASVAPTGSLANSAEQVFFFVAIEAGLVILLSAMERGISAAESLLRAQLGQRVNVMILEKAQRLQMRQFEDSEFYDKLTRARREASSRPLSLVKRTFRLLQNIVALLSLGVLLIQFSPWAVLLLLLGGMPAFIGETKFSGDAFRLFRWGSPERRKQLYLETVLAREDTIKEVKLFQIGPLLLQRYKDIYERLYQRDRNLTLRRDLWGFGLGSVGTAAFYSAYAWIVWATVYQKITLGQMTMYLMVFKQGQSAVSNILSSISGMYEDNLYLSNLYEFLEEGTDLPDGTLDTGPTPGDGVRFEAVSFSYPGATEPALTAVELHIKPGTSLALVGENGSGKTTLIKLLTRLYEPDSGRILLDGLDLREWRTTVLHRRVGVIFQDFVRYQMLVGENIGAGDVQRFSDEPAWSEAAIMGQADDFIERLSDGYHTQLGRWFAGGQELSGGQWQKVALARAFMRSDADILVLDEPTAAMDAAAEASVFEHFRANTAHKMAILISHRFSTVRMADQVVVLMRGRIIERGDHESLMQLDGHYARLFSLQAAGYR
ncbi:MAG: ATP-binding cassette subfamily B protein [Halieaceae bacterium]|jgi:ATP-binding cassette subfamily B protein